MKFNRRQFLANSFVGLATVFVLGKIAWFGRALAAGSFKTPAPADAADPTKGPAKAQKYVHFVSEYKGPKKKPTSNCLNCSRFIPAGTPNWGKCAMIGNKQAYEEGMCQVWTHNPKVPL